MLTRFPEKPFIRKKPGNCSRLPLPVELKNDIAEITRIQI
jgi:hypothetical protein